MTLDSIQLYATLQSATAHVVERCQEAGVKLPWIWISIYPDLQQKEPMIKLEDGRSGGVKVAGKHLDELVNEYIRRHQFEQAQQMLQIGHTTVEGTAAVSATPSASNEPDNVPLVPSAPEEDDDIPF